ncbi:MAG: PDZ domain-containing protein [Gemmataceae bacterium]|nr:PDZ domain-containing protein [Gemmataceae bacterium]MDW8265229.1 trypsin-like peptidase domain-containing protein [Gemmataceae bacterium]
MIRAAGPIGVLAAALVAAPASSANERTSLKEALALQETLQQAIHEAEPAIACILVSRSDAYRQSGQGPSSDEPGSLGSFDAQKPSRLPRPELKKLDLADPENVPESFGSGVVIDARGLILTNYHVVREATKIYVRLPGLPGSYADIHAADPRSDLAVLRLIDKRPVKPIRLGDGGQVRKGQFVLTIANPFVAGFRDGSPSASWGIVSDLRRKMPGPASETELTKTLHHYGTLIQTDTRLNLGCSGGALIDLKGELIGLTTALPVTSGADTAGALAIPIDAGIRRVIEVLRRGEEVEYGFLGVVLSKSNWGDGVHLADVGRDSPAWRAGLRQGDTVLAVNGVPVRDTDELYLAVGTLLAGSEAKLLVRSPGSTARTVSVKLAKYRVSDKLGPIIASQRPAPVRGLRVDYSSILLQGSGVLSGALSMPPGVCIREVQPNSPAEVAHLKVHDIITEVNRRPVHTPADFYREAGRVVGPLELTLLDPASNRTRLVRLP